LLACSGKKAHVYLAKDLDVRGQEDTRVIDKAVSHKCAIVTVNQDFLEYYRDHPWRRGKNGTFFYGLIFLKPSHRYSRKEQLKLGLQDIAWGETRRHDDIVFVSAAGKTRHERLCHKECAAAFPRGQREW
jgi:hypothetical protein